MEVARRPRVLLCFSGSVATVKIPEIFLKLHEFADVRLISSSSASDHFLNRSQQYNTPIWNAFEAAGGLSMIIDEQVEWIAWNKIGDLVIHIELRRWADMILVAPASADILAKVSSGISDTLLLSILRAWNFEKPCIFCPAMNTQMWEHPATRQSLDTLARWGSLFVMPISKELACKDVGNGALAKVDDIVSFVRDWLRDCNLDVSDDRLIRIIDAIPVNLQQSRARWCQFAAVGVFAVFSFLVTL